MRIEQTGKLRTEAPADAGYHPHASASCPVRDEHGNVCGSRDTYMSSGGGGPGMRYFTCRTGPHRFRMSVPPRA